MKKLALLSAVMTLGMSSWAFAADNPPPPPEKGAQHQGKPPVKNGQHDGKQAQYNSKQPGFRVRPFFILRQPSLTNSYRSLRCLEKSLHCA